MIKKIDSPELKENKIVMEFKGDYNIINIGGNYGIVSKKSSENDILNSLRESKEKEIKRKINIFHVEEAENFISYQNKPKYIEPNQFNLLQRLSPKFNSLISLSIFIENLYQEGNYEQAENLKRSVRERYGDFGLKFVNLWSRSYLRSLLDFFLQQPILPLDINNKFLEFIEKSDSIFFIHSKTDRKKVISEIKKSFKTGKEYIAIHSLGFSGLIGWQIINKIKTPKFSDYQEILISKAKGKIDISKIWYKGNGIKTYLLIKDIII